MYTTLNDLFDNTEYGKSRNQMGIPTSVKIKKLEQIIKKKVDVVAAIFNEDDMTVVRTEVVDGSFSSDGSEGIVMLLFPLNADINATAVLEGEEYNGTFLDMPFGDYFVFNDSWVSDYPELEEYKNYFAVMQWGAVDVTSLEAYEATKKDASKLNANGVEYVDLGLPSGTLWATCNVGATKPEGYGNYFMWGSTTPNGNDVCNWQNTPYCTNPSDPYNASAWSKYNKAGDTLDLEDDAAHVAMGGDWHMPSALEVAELVACTTSEWVTENSIKGRRFIGSNGNSIFIPAAGFRLDSSVGGVGSGCNLWSRSGRPDIGGACELGFDSGDVGLGSGDRCCGCSVRGVL